jgi:hypothetical protein
MNRGKAKRLRRDAARGARLAEMVANNLRLIQRERSKEGMRQLELKAIQAQARSESIP